MNNPLSNPAVRVSGLAHFRENLDQYLLLSEDGDDSPYQVIFTLPTEFHEHDALAGRVFAAAVGTIDSLARSAGWTADVAMPDASAVKVTVTIPQFSDVDVLCDAIMLVVEQAYSVGIDVKVDGHPLTVNPPA
jgi:hypothetical protein